MLPQEQCRNEMTAFLNRWVEESDLDDEQITEAVSDALTKWANTDIVLFDSDIDLDSDEELDMGETEEGG